MRRKKEEERKKNHSSLVLCQVKRQQASGHMLEVNERSELLYQQLCPPLPSRLHTFIDPVRMIRPTTPRRSPAFEGFSGYRELGLALLR